VTRLAVRADLTEWATLTDGLEAFGATHGLHPAVVSVMQLAVADLVTGMAGGPGAIQVGLAIEDAIVVVRVESDEQQALAPLELAASLMDEVSDSCVDGRHVITLRKAIR
jgi:hypothetical protein